MVCKLGRISELCARIQVDLAELSELASELVRVHQLDLKSTIQDAMLSLSALKADYSASAEIGQAMPPALAEAVARAIERER